MWPKKGPRFSQSQKPRPLFFELLKFDFNIFNLTKSDIGCIFLKCFFFVLFEEKKKCRALQILYWNFHPCLTFLKTEEWYRV